MAVKNPTPAYQPLFLIPFARHGHQKPKVSNFPEKDPYREVREWHGGLPLGMH
jgi:hypothetical protein